MKIKTTRLLDIPDKLICHHGRRECSALVETEGPGSKIRMCANFNHYCFWSDRAGYFVRCPECIDATLDYLRSREAQHE